MRKPLSTLESWKQTGPQSGNSLTVPFVTHIYPLNGTRRARDLSSNFVHSTNCSDVTSMESLSSESNFPCTIEMVLHSECPSSKLRHHCVQCGRLFSRRSHLSSHVRTHTGERPFQCKICKKGFTQSGSLYRHMRNHERIVNHNLSNATCIQCCRVFLSKKGLDAHLRAVHKTTVKSDLFVIPLCSQSLSVEPANNDWLPSFPVTTCEDNSTLFVTNDDQWVLPSVTSDSGGMIPPISPNFGDRTESYPRAQCMLCWQSFGHENLLSQHIFTAHFKSPPVSPSSKTHPVC